jgi:hypothetical protein
MAIRGFLFAAKDFLLSLEFIPAQPDNAKLAISSAMSNLILDIVNSLIKVADLGID